MWFDDLLLVKTMAHKYEARGPFVECGGIPDPTIAAYEKTIAAMADYRRRLAAYIAGDVGAPEPGPAEKEIPAAQMARYLKIHRPLSFLDPSYVCEDPATDGGLPLERLSEKYDHARGTGIGTAILLSVLEHVADPFHAIDMLRDAMIDGGLALVSVPFIFPDHPSPEDCFRFTPTGLRHVFGPWPDCPPRWEVLEADWRLDIPAEAGVLDIKTGRAQAIKSCYAVARAC